MGKPPNFWYCSSRLTEPLSNSWLPSAIAVRPSCDIARISTSPLNWLNTGAPSKMSPESTWIERAAGGPMSGSSVSHGGPV